MSESDEEVPDLISRPTSPDPDIVQTGMTQSGNAIAIGYNAGQSSNGMYAITMMGYNAGQYSSGSNAFAIGFQSGQTRSVSAAVAIGRHAGMTMAMDNMVAIGNNAGQNTSGSYAIAIGTHAGYSSSGSYAIAIGRHAGWSGIIMPAYSVGYNTGISGPNTYCKHIEGTGETLFNAVKRLYCTDIDHIDLCSHCKARKDVVNGSSYTETLPCVDNNLDVRFNKLTTPRNNPTMHNSTQIAIRKWYTDPNSARPDSYSYVLYTSNELGVCCQCCNALFMEYNEPRIVARTTLLKSDIMEVYAQKTMNPKHLQGLLDDPDKDIDEYMEKYINEL